jgi:hypothetical protein
MRIGEAHDNPLGSEALSGGEAQARVVGSGVHLMEVQRIDDHFWIDVPFARSINPISKANWEDTGAERDIKARPPMP